PSGERTAPALGMRRVRGSPRSGPSGTEPGASPARRATPPRLLETVLSSVASDRVVVPGAGRTREFEMSLPYAVTGKHSGPVLPGPPCRRPTRCRPERQRVTDRIDGPGASQPTEAMA